MNKNLNKKILCTLGPSSLHKGIIERMDLRGVNFFRINMSHTSLEDLEKNIELIQKFSKTPICIDTEGAQIRNQYMEDNISYVVGDKIKIFSDNSVGNQKSISIVPPNVLNQLSPGTILTVDFDGVMILVENVFSTYLEGEIINGGKVTHNRAITSFPSISLSPLTKKDIEAVNVAKNYGINNFALSFTNCKHDVEILRELTGKNAEIISKIETINGVKNLSEILKEADAILIDRGDLSREVPLENIPFLQKKIIATANRHQKNVYVATNLLESMIVNKKPTRAELNDVINTLEDGADGLVLAAETAIGKNPIESLDILNSLIKCHHENNIFDYQIDELTKPRNILLPDYHGKSNSVFSKKILEISKKDIDNIPKIEIDSEQTQDALNILNQTFSPLKGFMNKDDLNTCVDSFKIQNDCAWSLPIILQTDKKQFENLILGDQAILFDKGTSQNIAIIEIEQLFEIDVDQMSNKIFGTNDTNHPGAGKFINKGGYIVSGKLNQISKKMTMSSALNPVQTRSIFQAKGWTNVVGFHTRNIPHKGHEFLMKTALENNNLDAVLIHPVVGHKKNGDFETNVIMGAYNTLLQNKFLENKSLLTGFETYSRYAGPREAIFTAICRKNFGCNHFIVGRDHTGVGSYYEDLSVEDIFNKIGDFGMNIIFFNEIVYDSKNKIHTERKSDSKYYKPLKGTDVRNFLVQKESVPEWLVSSAVKEYLLKQKTLFIK